MPTLFLCEANAGLSQIAEALARELRPDAEVWSAGAYPSHVLPDVRRVLAESGARGDNLRAKGIHAIPLEDVTLVVRIGLGVDDVRLPGHVRVLNWRLPDPAAYPVDERLDAWRAGRDELARRIAALPVEDLR